MTIPSCLYPVTAWAWDRVVVRNGSRAPDPEALLQARERRLTKRHAAALRWAKGEASLTESKSERSAEREMEVVSLRNVGI